MPLFTTTRIENPTPEQQRRSDAVFERLELMHERERDAACCHELADTSDLECHHDCTYENVKCCDTCEKCLVLCTC